MIPPLVLGGMKMPLARELHDRVLHASTTLDKGDWLSGIGGAAGILGIAFGLCWADSAGGRPTSRPSDIKGGRKDPAIDKATAGAGGARVGGVRLREDGDVLTGEAFLVAADGENLLERMEEARRGAGERGLAAARHQHGAGAAARIGAGAAPRDAELCCTILGKHSLAEFPARRRGGWTALEASR